LYVGQSTISCCYSVPLPEDKITEFLRKIVTIRTSNMPRRCTIQKGVDFDKKPSHSVI
jgi:hypothetical protein